jgi:hypothetical protein
VGEDVLLAGAVACAAVGVANARPADGGGGGVALVLGGSERAGEEDEDEDELGGEGDANANGRAAPLPVPSTPRGPNAGGVVAPFPVAADDVACVRSRPPGAFPRLKAGVAGPVVARAAAPPGDEKIWTAATRAARSSVSSDEGTEFSPAAKRRNGDDIPSL